MKCTSCGYIESKVIDSRVNELSTSIRRRRECIQCGKRFTTYESLEISPIFVIKKSGARQQFSPAKIRTGIIKACEKRPVSIAIIDKLVEDITRNIENSLDAEVTSKHIGDLIMEGLKDVDEVAYVRYAAVHRQFKDINSWLAEIEQVIKSKSIKKGGTDN